MFSSSVPLKSKVLDCPWSSETYLERINVSNVSVRKTLLRKNLLLKTDLEKEEYGSCAYHKHSGFSSV